VTPVNNAEHSGYPSASKMDENLAWINKSVTIFDMTDEVQVSSGPRKSNLTQDLNV
jgi:hypothetical protein